MKYELDYYTSNFDAYSLKRSIEMILDTGVFWSMCTGFKFVAEKFMFNLSFNLTCQLMMASIIMLITRVGKSFRLLITLIFEQRNHS